MPIIVTIGVAPTALGACYRLNELKENGAKEAQNFEIICLEQEAIPGGLSCTAVDEMGFLWDMGGHVTFSNHQYYKTATRWAVEEWNEIGRNCKVDMSPLWNEPGIHLVPYPAQFAVPLFPNEHKEKCLRDLRERYSDQNGKLSKNATFEEWVLRNFGPAMNEAFFIPYTIKVWTLGVEEMSSNWVGERVAKLPKERLEELCAMSEDEVVNADFGWGPNALFSFPKRGGTGNVWKSMATKLPQKFFKYKSKVTKVDYENHQLIYEDLKNGENKTIKYDYLLSTSPIDILVEETQITRPLNIKRNKVFVIGVGLKKPITPFLENMTWLYFPDSAVPFFRVTVLSRYGEMTPNGEKYWSLLVECARKPEDTTASEEEIKKATVAGLVRKGMIEEGNIVSLWSTTLNYGYPIPTPQRDEELARAHRELEKWSIYSRGRFGGWKYEVSNQDHCFLQGKEFIDRIVLGEPERMYKTCVDEFAEE